MKNINVEKLTDRNRLTVNVLYSLVGQTVPIIAGIVSIPILIRSIGTDRFGILTLSWIIISYFSLFDLGLGRALTQLVAEKIGKGDSKASISELAWTASFLMSTFGVLGAIVFSGLSPWLVRQVLNIPPEIQDETLSSFYILALSIPLVTITSGFIGLLSALQRFDLINLIKIPFGTFMFIGPLMVLPFSSHLTYIIGILLVGRIGCLIVYGQSCFKAMPELTVHRNIRYSLLLPLIQFGGWMTLSNIVGPLMVYMDRFLISGILSVTSVAYYSTPYELVTKLWIIPGSLVNVLFPAFSANFLENPKRVEKLFHRGVHYIFLIIFPISIMIIIFAHEGLNLWLGKEFAENGTVVLQLLTIGVLINSLSQIPFSFIQGLGRPDITSKLHLIELPIYLVTLTFLATKFGLIGVAVAWVLRIFCDTLMLFFMARPILFSKKLVTKELAMIMFLIFLTFPIVLFDLLFINKIILLVFYMSTFITLGWTYLISKEDKVILKELIILKYFNE